MKRAAKFALLFCLAAGLMFAEGSEGGEGEGNLVLWKWANFVLLAGGLGYLIVKMLPPIFVERTEALRKDMTESDKIRKDAEARAADVERRLAGLEVEIAALRTESQKEAQAETQRLAEHTTAEIAKIQALTQREIAAAGKAARLELKRYAAGLAVDLAEQKIRARMTPATQDGLVRGFVRDLK